jgi:hypothetical protein
VPINDNFTNALVLEGSMAETTCTNYSASVEPGEPAHDGLGPSRSVWWRWTAPADGIVEVDATALAYITPGITPVIPTNILLNFLAIFGISPDLISIPLIPTNFQAIVVSPTNISIVSDPARSTIPRFPRSMIPLVAGIYTGSQLANLTPVSLIPPESFDDGSGGASVKKYRFVATAGETYQIAVDSSPRYIFSLTLSLGRILIVQPSAETRLRGSQPVTLEFRAFDTNNPAVWVEAFIGTNCLGVQTHAPFQFTYTAAQPGTYSISAVATNSAGERVFALPTPFTFTPANDDFSDATIIPGNLAQSTFSEVTELATTEPGEPEQYAGIPATNSVWWRWTPSYPGETVVRLFAPGSPQKIIRLALFKGATLTTLQLLNSVAAGGVVLPGYDPNPTIIFTPEPGATYFIVTDSDTSISWRFDQRTLDLVPAGFPERGHVNIPINLHATWQEDSPPLSGVQFVIGTQVYPSEIHLPYIGPTIQETGTLAVAESFPYSINWSPSETGRYFVWARATNSLGFTKESKKTEFWIYTANDNFSNAQVIASQTVATNIEFDITWSSVEAGEPAHGKDAVVRSCWWSWTPASSQSVRIKAVQVSTGLPLDIFIKDSSGNLRLLASNRDRVYEPGFSGIIRVPVKAGRTYYLRVADTRVPLASPGPPGIPLPAYEPPPPVRLTIEPANAPMAGEINFSFFAVQLTRNRHKPVQVMPVARVFLPDGRTPVTGSTYMAQLYAGPAASNLEAAGTPQPFFTPNGLSVPFAWAGVVMPEPVLLPNVTAYHRVYAQVRVWETASGDTYEAAATNGGHVGASAVLQLMAGSEESGPAPLKGLTSFKVQ